jgi:hypothetical protein
MEAVIGSVAAEGVAVSCAPTADGAGPHTLAQTPLAAASVIQSSIVWYGLKSVPEG